MRWRRRHPAESAPSSFRAPSGGDVERRDRSGEDCRPAAGWRDTSGATTELIATLSRRASSGVGNPERSQRLRCPTSLLMRGRGYALNAGARAAGGARSIANAIARAAKQISAQRAARQLASRAVWRAARRHDRCAVSARRCGRSTNARDNTTIINGSNRPARP